MLCSCFLWIRRDYCDLEPKWEYSPTSDLWEWRNWECYRLTWFASLHMVFRRTSQGILASRKWMGEPHNLEASNWPRDNYAFESPMLLSQSKRLIGSPKWTFCFLWSVDVLLIWGKWTCRYNSLRKSIVTICQIKKNANVKLREKLLIPSSSFPPHSCSLGALRDISRTSEHLALCKRIWLEFYNLLLPWTHSVLFFWNGNQLQRQESVETQQQG